MFPSQGTLELALPRGREPRRTLESRDVLVVLGCRVAPGHLSSAALRRCERAAQAWFAGGFGRIIVSGGKHWNAVTEADRMAAQLVELGVPERAIVRELLSLTTYENAYYSGRILKHFASSNVLVVSCAFHLPRALREFERQGLRVSGLAAEAAPAASGSLGRNRARRDAWSERILERLRGWLQASLHPWWSL